MQVVYGVMPGKLGTNATGASSYYVQVSSNNGHNVRFLPE